MLILKSVQICSKRCNSSFAHTASSKSLHAVTDIVVNGKSYSPDSWTNITPKISSFIGKNLHLRKNHPLWLIRERILSYFNWKYPAPGRRSPAFAAVDNLDPVVTTEQNFDSILVPEDHVSRSKSDSYYVNQKHILRAHTSAHQRDLLRSGLREFLVIGDVYRRDEIDSTHFPVFHQCEGVRLRHRHELKDGNFRIFEENPCDRSPTKQESHTQEASDLMEKDLKDCLECLIRSFFGQKAELRWTSTYFPFTHPSWELEVKFHNEWLELLGCGIMEQKILRSVGIDDQIGWAFGIGLERVAMKLYEIPDIRLFWSEDSGFLSQFEVGENLRKPVKYQSLSQFPQCINDISFWVPNAFDRKDFYELVRSYGGNLVEQVKLVDEFIHPKTGQKSNCYRIIYRHMEKTLTKEEVNRVHALITKAATEELGVEPR